VSHANARLTFLGRCLLVRRVREQRRPVAHVAKEMGVSRQCAHRWIARFDVEGWPGLHDRSSRPRSCPRATPAGNVQAVLAHRDRRRAGRDEIAAATGTSPRTVSRILARHGRPPLAWLDPVTGTPIRGRCATVSCYERGSAGDLIHIDVKKIGRIPDGGGWRALGRATSAADKCKRPRIGFDYVHSAVDDHSRLAYSEIHADEKGPTCAGFLTRAAAWFAAAGITSIREVITDNAFAYRRSQAFRGAVAALTARQLFIKPHCPWQNGKVERFNRTLQIEWAYRQIFTSNDDRTAALGQWLHHYNTERCHTALGGQPPISRAPSPM
jgi:transposase InsO family protein